MQLVCETICDDCGPGIIVNPNTVSIIKLDDDFTAFTLCPYCDQVIHVPVDPILAVELSEKGVAVLSWDDANVGEQGP